MSKAEKLAAKIHSGKSDKNLAFNDLCYVLERAGLQFWKRKSPDLLQRRVLEIVNVQPRNGKAKPYQVKQVRELLLEYEMDIQ